MPGSADSSRGDGSTGQLDQFNRIPSVKRQFQNTLIFNNRPDACCLRFYQRRVGFDLHLLVNGADLKHDVDRGNRRNLQRNAGPQIRTEARRIHLQPVRSNRQVR